MNQALRPGRSGSTRTPLETTTPDSHAVQMAHGLAQGSGRAVRWLTGLSLVVTLSVLALGILILLQARNDAWVQAQRSADNLSLALERDIARNFATLDLSLQGAADAWQMPGLGDVPPSIRQSALFDRAASAEYLGSLLILNSRGDIVADSTALQPHALNFSDRDYFQVQRAQPTQGFYVSHVFRSRLRSGDAGVALSRRLTGEDGSFQGVVMGVLRLAYFNEMFSHLNMGQDGTVSLFRDDGQLLARKPIQDSDIGRNLSTSPNFQQALKGNSGHFTATATLDGFTRLYTYRRIGNLPLILITGTSLEEIYAPWRQKALMIGSILGVLCLATMALCLLFRREMLRRRRAETELLEANDRLEVMAATDALTGLANRRAFERVLQQEWRRAIRAQTPLALMMLDADWFKSLNDTQGHAAGDRVLRAIGGCIQQNALRPSDVAARYGGEEFVVIMPETDAEGALVIAERMRQAIQALALPHAGSASGVVTVSVGVASGWPQTEAGGAQLLRQADGALYDAKAAGRNRTMLAGQDATARLRVADGLHRAT